MLNFYFHSWQNFQKQPQVKDPRLLINDITKELVQGPKQVSLSSPLPPLLLRTYLIFTVSPLMLSSATYGTSTVVSLHTADSILHGLGNNRERLETSRSKAEDWIGWAGAEVDEEKDDTVRTKKPRGPEADPHLTGTRNKARQTIKANGCKWCRIGP